MLESNLLNSWLKSVCKDCLFNICFVTKADYKILNTLMINYSFRCHVVVTFSIDVLYSIISCIQSSWIENDCHMIIYIFVLLSFSYLISLSIRKKKITHIKLLQDWIFFCCSRICLSKVKLDKLTLLSI